MTAPLKDGKPEPMQERITQLEYIVRRLAEYAGVDGKMAHLLVQLDPPAAPTYPRVTGKSGRSYELREGVIWLEAGGQWDIAEGHHISFSDVLAVASLLRTRTEFAEPEWLDDDWIRTAWGTQRGNTSRYVILAALRRYHDERQQELAE